jgi:transposase
VIADEDDHRLRRDTRACLQSLGRQFLSLHEEICAADKRLHAWHRSSPVSQRLATTTTLLIIIVVLLLLGGGWFGRGRWY